MNYNFKPTKPNHVPIIQIVDFQFIIINSKDKFL
jgi:hypothetical protein